MKEKFDGMFAHLTNKRETEAPVILEELRKEMESEMDTDEAAQHALRVFAEILGDEEAAESFINSDVVINFKFDDESYVVSPVLWGMLSLVPQDFAASHFVILMHLIRLQHRLLQSKNEMAEAFKKEMYLTSEKLEDVKRSAYNRARDSKRSQEDSKSVAAEAVVDLKRELFELTSNRDSSLATLDSNIKYVKEVIDSIRNFVQYMGNVGGVAPTFSQDQLVSVINHLSSNQ